MYKLLNAGLERIKKNKIFWVFIILSALIAIYSVILKLFFDYGDKVTLLDELYLNYINIIGIFIGIFMSLFIGAEYAYGTIRNKLIVGHSRANIYISNLIISVIARNCNGNSIFNICRDFWSICC